MIPDESIDELCEALFHANVAQVSNLPYSAGVEPRASTPAPARGRTTLSISPRTADLARFAPRRVSAAASRLDKPRSRNRIALVWLAACLLLGGWLGSGGVLTQRSRSTQSDEARPSVTAVAASQGPRTVNIEDIRVGQRVVADNPDHETTSTANETQVDPRTWRLVRLHGEARWEDGTLDTIEVETLQPPDWVRRFAPRVGVSAPIPLDLVDMGMPAQLRATVVAIELCPVIEQGPGHVVLTTVNHLNSFLLELTFVDAQGGEQTIKPTGFHKFFSQSRLDWVPVSELVELNPSWPGGFERRASIYRQMANYDRALADCATALCMNANSPRALWIRAAVHAHFRREDEAIADFTEVIRLTPDDTSAYANRGLAYARKRDFDRAIEDYTEAIRLNPTWAEAFEHRGRAHYRIGGWTSAISDFTRALELKPDLKRALEFRALAHESLGDYASATEDRLRADEMGRSEGTGE